MRRLHLFGLLLSVALILLSACGNRGTTTTGGSAPSNTQAGPQEVKISIGDFYIKADMTTFMTDKLYRFVIVNEGERHHDFLIMRPMGTGVMTMDSIYSMSLAYINNLAPGETRTLEYTFKQPAPKGSLEFNCHYAGHYEAGMYMSILVEASPGNTAAPMSNAGDILPTATSVSSGPCTPPVNVTIGVDAGKFAFIPESVSLKMGETLTITDTTGTTHTLKSLPDASMRFTVVDPNEAEHVPFTKSGTYTISSVEHPEAKLNLTVATEEGRTCGRAASQTVSFSAEFANGQATAGKFFFAPATVELKEGESITLSNLADEDLTFRSTPDAGLGDIRINKNENQLLTFGKEGTFTITAVQFPDVHLMVVVEEEAGEAGGESVGDGDGN